MSSLGQRCALSVILASTFGLTFSLSLCAQESPSFVMERVTISATGAVAASPSFEMTATFGQAVPVGAASRCNDGFQASAGFWSMLGDQPVPTFLLVDKDLDAPGEVSLSWTGAASQFNAYRSSIATLVVDPGNFIGSSFACSKTDLPPVAPITFYQIIPTGP